MKFLTDDGTYGRGPTTRSLPERSPLRPQRGNTREAERRCTPGETIGDDNLTITRYGKITLAKRWGTYQPLFLGVPNKISRDGITPNWVKNPPIILNT